MSDPQAKWGERAASLRRAFDRSFAERPSPAAAAGQDFLAIGLGGVAHGLRLAEIEGLIADKPIVRIPTLAVALLGGAGFRGTIVPVYDLQALLGYPPLETARWMVIANRAAVAFAFTVFERHLRVSEETILAREAASGSARFVREFFSDGRVTRSIVHLPSVIEAIKRDALPSDPARNDHV